MAYEFKKLSDVEVVAEPTESANVLIEEDGVIKKAPKTTIGGNTGWDAVICQQYENGQESFSFVTGSYDEVRRKLLASEPVNIRLYHTTDNNHYEYPILRLLWDEEDEEIEITVFNYKGEVTKFII